MSPSAAAAEFEGAAIRNGTVYSLDDFEHIASTFEHEWFGGEAIAAAAGPAEREAEFWRIVEDGEDEAEALYASELDSTKVGSGFPRAPPSDPYARSPWNLNNLPRAGLLRALPAGVPGLTAPLVDVGMLFSSFTWRVTEQLLYSVNYAHWGAPKRWYAVPGHGAGLFEAAARALLPDHAATQPDLLFQLSTMLSPSALAARGVPVCALTQEPGTFVLTFPNAYHAGLCLGVGCSEAVAAAPDDWLRFGAASLSRYRHYRKHATFSHERLLADIAGRAAAAEEPAAAEAAAADAAAAPAPAARGPVLSPPSERTCYWVDRELRRAVDEERTLRAKLWSEGLRRSRRIDPGVGLRSGDREDAQCAVCHLFVHFSAVECDCCPRRRVCLHHAGSLCQCPMRRRRLAWRHSLQELEGLHAGVAARVPPALAAAIDAEEALLAAAERDALVETTTAAAAAAPKLEAATEVKTEDAEAPAAPEVKAEEAETEAETEAAAEAGTPAPMDADDELSLLAGFASGAAAVAGGSGDGDGAARKRKRSESSPAPDLPLAASLLSANGFVQGPVRPFAPLDVFPEDREAAEGWLAELEAGFEPWVERVNEALTLGGAAAADLQSLLEEGEQFAWGGAGEARAASAAELRPRLAAAADFMADVNAALRGKPALEHVEELLSRHPPPLANPPGLDKLGEAVDAAREWLGRYGALADPIVAPVEARALEVAVAEASRLPVTLPEGRALKERLATARKVAEAIRTALPTSREAGRRRKDEAAVTVESLKALRAQAAAAGVEMPEASNLSAALERVEAWRGRLAALEGLRPPMADLRALWEESEALPAAMPEADELRALIEKGDAWLRQAAALVRSRAPLKKASAKLLLHL